jgi:hypothetical protein
MTYTDKHSGKVYSISHHFYGRKVTQYPVGTKVHFDGSATNKPTAEVAFKTQAERNSWLRMMGFKE